MSMMKRKRPGRWRTGLPLQAGGVGHLAGHGGGEEADGLEETGHVGHITRTMMTAMLCRSEPRPMPSTIEAAMPLEAAGTLTRNTVSMWVAPRASEASSYSLGTALRAVSDTEMMEAES